MTTRPAPEEAKRRRRVAARAALEAKLKKIDKGYRALTSGIAARDRAAAALAKAEARCGSAIAELLALDLSLDEIATDTEIPCRELRRLLKAGRASQEAPADTENADGDDESVVAESNEEAATNGGEAPAEDAAVVEPDDAVD